MSLAALYLIWHKDIKFVDLCPSKEERTGVKVRQRTQNILKIKL
jgi:hypothetical protein